jgi:hypothetical protein
MPTDDDRPELTRMTVNLMPKAADALNAVSQRERESKTDAVNRALQLYDFISRQAAAGTRILLEAPDGQQRAVEFL